MFSLFFVTTKQYFDNNSDSPFTLDKINLAISMQNSKALCPNSLEFFKKIYTYVYTDFLLNGSLSCIKMSFSKSALGNTSLGLCCSYMPIFFDSCGLQDPCSLLISSLLLNNMDLLKRCVILCRGIFVWRAHQDNFSILPGNIWHKSVCVRESKYWWECLSSPAWYQCRGKFRLDLPHCP